MLTLLAFWIPDPGERDRLVRHAEEAAERAEARLAAVGEADGVREAVLAHIEANLREKAERPEGPFPLTAEDIERRVVDWEAFRAEAFVTSGVFPKRYFGYVDGKGDTAAEEARVHRAVAASVDAGNAWLGDQGVEWRITDAEVLTTWLSEGGALWLQGGEIPVPARFHPVFDVGLDDLASGAADLADLRRRLDRSAGTDLDAERLWRTSEDNAHRRPRLPVTPAADGLALLRAGKPYPEQPTSWVGVYHVLQRFGGFLGLTGFTGVFRDSHYRTRQP